MTNTIRWGILGTGGIAAQFARGITSVVDAELVAVGSRTTASAQRFATEFGVAQAHGSYAELAADDNVDVVYVATPHPAHAENAILCLQAGKAVLCEKPFTLNARQATAVIEVARRKHLFLMEAMWTRWLPAMVRVRDLIGAGAIGEPRMLYADFGFRTPVNPAGRLFAPELGGGALLDVGVYPVSLASMIFGEPGTMKAMAHLGATRVDEQSAVILGYGAGQLAVLSAAISTTTPQTATLCGTAGMIHLPAPWYCPTRVVLTRAGQQPETTDLPLIGNGYNYEAEEVMRCLRSGKLESDTMPWHESLAIMQTLDRIRDQWGLRYPAEADLHIV